MNSYNGVVAYNDEKIKVIVYKNFEGQQYVITNKIVYTGNVVNVSSVDEIEKIAKNLNEVLGRIEDEIGERIHRVDLIVEPNQFYYESKTFEVEFEEAHKIEEEDIKKIIDKAIRYDTAKSGYTTVNFTPVKYLVDGVKRNNPINEVAKKIIVTGDLVFVDIETLYPLERIIEDSRYRKNNTLVSSHLLKYARGFSNKEAIIEFGRMKMKFLTKSEDLVQNFNMDFGIGHIYQKTYMELVDKYPKEESEKVVRYLQNNFKLSEQVFDFEIVAGISYNYALSIFKKIASEYIQGIILQVYKQGIEFKKVYSITNDYPNNEWVTYLNTFLNIDVVEFKVPIVAGNFDDELKVFNAISVAEKLRLKG